MGRVMAPWGVKGWVRVEPFSTDRESLCSFPEWWVGKSGALHKIAVRECRPHGASLIARFEGCGDPDQARAYRGSDVAVRREDLPRTAENEFYQDDLVGLEVLNVQGESLGRVAGFLNNGAHSVVRIERRSGPEYQRGERLLPERLIPFVPAVVRSVNLEAGVIEVDWGADW